MKWQPHIVIHGKMSVNQAPAVFLIRLQYFAILCKNAHNIFLGETFFYHVPHSMYFHPIAAGMHERSYSFSQFLQINISPFRIEKNVYPRPLTS